MRTALGVVLASVVLALPATADSARLVRVAGNFDATVYATKKSGSLYVVEQEGQIWRKRSGTRTLFLDIRGDVSCCGEEGLLSLAFDGNFASNRYIYVNYTNNSSNIVFARFRANSTFTRAPASSRRIIASVGHPGATNHNGGALHFGPDGKLYVAVGDNANGANAQSLGNLLGKMLRINPDGSIPSDNPFYGSAGGQNRAIWALGLRNPFTFSFQRGSSRMFINDVGENSWEEINDGIAGSNYGWPATEGPTSDPRFQGPRYAYMHDGDDNCAITGGAQR